MLAGPLELVRTSWVGGEPSTVASSALILERGVSSSGVPALDAGDDAREEAMGSDRRLMLVMKRSKWKT